MRTRKKSRLLRLSLSKMPRLPNRHAQEPLKRARLLKVLLKALLRTLRKEHRKLKALSRLRRGISSRSKYTRANGSEDLRTCVAGWAGETAGAAWKLGRVETDRSQGSSNAFREVLKGLQGQT